MIDTYPLNGGEVLPPGIARILRELSLTDEPVSQAQIAQSTACSRSMVSKVVGMLQRKRLVHRPTRSTVAVANLQYLLLYWAFRRDLEDDRRTIVETSLGGMELEDSLGETQDELAFTSFSAARAWGSYRTPYSEIYAYDLAGASDGLDLPRGRNSTLVMLRWDDEHLKRRSMLRNGLRVVPVRQAYVDLLSISTWEAKYAAMSLSQIDPLLPLIGTRSEMGEYL
jgi:hypothetical protein